VSKKSDDYVDEASGNIKTDREKLEELYKQLLDICKTDPLALLSAGEPLVKIVDSLTKQNSQVIELAKIKQKSEMTRSKSKGESGFDEEEEEEVWNEFDARNG